MSDFPQTRKSQHWWATRRTVWRAGLVLGALLCAGLAGGAQEPAATPQGQEAKAHLYIKAPVNELQKTVPELKKLQPVGDASALPVILKNTGRNVDEFFHDVVDLIAQEQIIQERQDFRGAVTARARIEDHYLILRHGDAQEAEIEEYRMDSAGNRLERPGLNRGYLVTSGFALVCNYFSMAYQPGSEFRLLGEEKIGSYDTYAVAFAQLPGRANLFVTMTGRGGASVKILMQGIAWIDKSDFQIIRIRTDPLSARPEVGLERQTTVVTLSRVQLPDVSAPLWLPKEVKVELMVREDAGVEGVIHEARFRNEHRYADYQRYRVSVKMVAPK